MITRETRISFIIVCALFASITNGSAQSNKGDSAKTFDVCEVLASIESLTGKTVRIRGEWKSGDHGSWISAIRKCDRPLSTEDYLWSSSIHLESNKSSMLDFDALARFELALDQNRGKRSKEQVFFEDRILVDVVGVLRSNLPLVVVRIPGKTMPGNGYGHMNFHPVQLSFNSIQLNRIERRSKSEQK